MSDGNPPQGSASVEPHHAPVRRRLRDSSMIRLPGRYQEDMGPTRADRPIFVHPTVPYNASLARHCAFPSLPLDYPGRGPSEMEKERQEAEAAAREKERRASLAAEEAMAEFESAGEDSDGLGSATEQNREEGSLGWLASVHADGDNLDDGTWQPPSRRWHRMLAVAEGSSAHINGGMAVEHEADTQSEATIEEGSEVAREPSGEIVNDQSDQGTDGEVDDEMAGQEQADRDQTGPEQSEELRSMPTEHQNSGTRTGDLPRGPQHDSSDHPSRPARVSVIPRRERAQPSINPLYKAVPPQWPELPRAIRHAILYELSKTMSFVQAARVLRLTAAEVTDVMEQIGIERQKKQVVHAENATHPDPTDLSWLDGLAKREDLWPVNDPITSGDIDQGRAYLKYMGLSDLAAKLGYWEGTGGGLVDIDIDHWLEDGWRDLPLQFSVTYADEIEQVREAEQERARRQPPAMSSGELLVRMDPPPHTINPQRLKLGQPGSHPPSSGQLPNGLHPENYAVRVQSGKRFSVLDNSPWPERVALEDLGLEVDDDLKAATAQSEVPEVNAAEDVPFSAGMAPSAAAGHVWLPLPTANTLMPVQNGTDQSQAAP